MLTCCWFLIDYSIDHKCAWYFFLFKTNQSITICLLVMGTQMVLDRIVVNRCLLIYFKIFIFFAYNKKN